MAPFAWPFINGLSSTIDKSSPLSTIRRGKCSFLFKHALSSASTPFLSIRDDKKDGVILGSVLGSIALFIGVLWIILYVLHTAARTRQSEGASETDEEVEVETFFYIPNPRYPHYGHPTFPPPSHPGHTQYQRPFQHYQPSSPQRQVVPYPTSNNPTVGVPPPYIPEPEDCAVPTYMMRPTSVNFTPKIHVNRVKWQVSDTKSDFNDSAVDVESYRGDREVQGSAWVRQEMKPTTPDGSQPWSQPPSWVGTESWGGAQSWTHPQQWDVSQTWQKHDESRQERGTPLPHGPTWGRLDHGLLQVEPDDEDDNATLLGQPTPEPIFIVQPVDSVDPFLRARENLQYHSRQAVFREIQDEHGGCKRSSKRKDKVNRVCGDTMTYLLPWFSVPGGPPVAFVEVELRCGSDQSENDLKEKKKKKEKRRNDCGWFCGRPWSRDISKRKRKQKNV